MWTFEVHRGLSSIMEALPEERWLAVFQASQTASMSQHPSIILSWYKTYCQLWGREAIVLIGRNGQRQAVSACELSESRFNGLKTRVLSAVGGAVHFDFQDPLVTGSALSEGEVEEFWFDFKRCVHSEIPDCQLVVHHRLHEGFAPKTLVKARHSTVCPYIDLAEKRSLDDVLANCSGSHRGDVKRQIRRLSQMGDLSIKQFAPDELPQAQAALQDFFQAYDQQWSTKGSHALETVQGRAFFEELLNRLLSTGLLHWSVLCCGERVIHWHLGFVHSNRFYFYKLAGHQDWRNFSPGKVHIALLLEQCMARGLRYFDFLYGDESYKFTWTAYAYTLHRIEWWNGWQPLRRMLRDVVRPAYQKVRSLLRPSAHNNAT